MGSGNVDDDGRGVGGLLQFGPMHITPRIRSLTPVRPPHPMVTFGARVTAGADVVTDEHTLPAAERTCSRAAVVTVAAAVVAAAALLAADACAPIASSIISFAKKQVEGRPASMKACMQSMNNSKAIAPRSEKV